jgi:sortase (surface protein transpeptidase)
VGLLAPAAAAVAVAGLACVTIWAVTASLQPVPSAAVGVLMVPAADSAVPILDVGDEAQLHPAPGSPAPGDRGVVTLTGLCPASVATPLRRGDPLILGTATGTLRYVVTDVRPAPLDAAPRPPDDEGALIVITCAPETVIRALLDPRSDTPPTGGG